MALEPVHELHARRFGRNVGIGLVLGSLVALIFGLTIVKVSTGDNAKAFGHAPEAAQMDNPSTSTAPPLGW